MLATVMAAAFQHVNEALEVGVNISVRVLKRIADACLGCEMNDNRKTVLRKQRLHYRAIGQIELHKAEPGLALQNVEASLLQPGVVVIVDAVEADNFAPP